MDRKRTWIPSQKVNEPLFQEEDARRLYIMQDWEPGFHEEGPWKEG